MLKIFNSLKREKQIFEPIEANRVRMYVCGMTVYDYCHLGHARVMVVFDMVYRWLKASGYDVTYVRNITDIDDKIIRRAQENGETILQLTDRFIAFMHEDADALGVLRPDHEPRATEFVPQMQDIIRQLEANGLAYQAADGDVNYAVRKFPGYGKLSGKSLDDLRAGERVEVDNAKQDPLDFVLWKNAKPGEPAWESPWGNGRPGWHIECSAMSAAYLGEVFDIHGGGLDLIFPHHENEIAQSCCAHGTQRMANVWMHNGFLQVEGRKMSKSEGNFVTIHELLETEKFGGRKWPGPVLRLAMLMTNYREPIDFSVRRLEEAYSMWLRWARALAEPYGAVRLSQEVVEAVSNDLDVSKVLRLISRYDSAAFRSGLSGMETNEEIEERRMEGAGMLAGALSLLGIDLSEGMSEREERVTRQMVERRLTLIAHKNWPEADRIRDELLAQGIQLKDGKDPVTGERVTTWEVKR